MFRLALTNLFRRRLRSALTATGIAIAVAVLLLIDQIGSSYRAQLLKELNSMGLHLMIVPLGCPYDAAARVLKGNVLETSLPETVLEQARADSRVEIAAPLLIAAVPRTNEGRTDMFVGLDENGIALKSWWKTDRGAASFEENDSIIFGADAAQAEMREPGDRFYSPELDRAFKVAGVLERSGTSDDNLFFLPLRTAQEAFNSTHRVTAVAIRLRDPASISDVSDRLREIPGAQIVTQTEMMGTFLNILGTVRTLLLSIGWVAFAASVAGLINTLLMSVVERAFEFSLFRAVGASRVQLMGVISLESLLLTGVGLLAGFIVSLGFSSVAARYATDYLPLFQGAHFILNPASIVSISMLGVVVALVASLLPAWRASTIDPAALLKGVE